MDSVTFCISTQMPGSGRPYIYKCKLQHAGKLGLFEDKNARWPCRLGSGGGQPCQAATWAPMLGANTLTAVSPVSRSLVPLPVPLGAAHGVPLNGMRRLGAAAWHVCAAAVA